MMKTMLCTALAAAATSFASASPQEAIQQMGAAGLESFYSDDSIAVWKSVLGDKMHYHHGFFDVDADANHLDAASIDAAMAKAVTSLLPFLAPRSNVLDVGSGWCGPLGVFADHHHNVTGLTVSAGQAAYCREAGHDIVLGDAEATTTQSELGGKGPFDAAVMLESLSHIRNQSALLRWLATQTPRLVLRVNTRPAGATPVVFGDSMTLPTAAELKQMVEAAGWRIKYWQNERAVAHQTLDVYKRRLASLSRSASNGTQIEVLRNLTRLTSQRGRNNGTWAETHGLITVVALTGDDVHRHQLDTFPDAPAASPCQQAMDLAVGRLTELLHDSTQAELLTSSDGETGPQFDGLFTCVVGALRPHAEEIRVPVRDGAVSAAACPDEAFWIKTLLRLSTKMTIDAAGRLVAAANRYSVSVPRTIGSPLQRAVVQRCLTTALAAPAEITALYNSTSGGRDEIIELGVAWPNADRPDGEVPSARLYVSESGGSTDAITSFEWKMAWPASGDYSTVGRNYILSGPRGSSEHAQCLDGALLTELPTTADLAQVFATAESCWTSDRGDRGIKFDLKLAQPLPLATVPNALLLPMPVVLAQLAVEQDVAVTLISVQPSTVTLYYQLRDAVSTASSITEVVVVDSKASIAMPHYPLPAHRDDLLLVPALERDTFFRDVLGRHSRHFRPAIGDVGAFTLAQPELKAMLQWALAQDDDSIVSWKMNGTAVRAEDDDQVQELTSDVDRAWNTLTAARSHSAASQPQLSVVLRRMENSDNEQLRQLHATLMATLGSAVSFNLYLSAPDATALKPHTDPYDVLVVQLAGAKQWQICPAATSRETVGMTESDAAEVLELQKHKPLGCNQVDDALSDADLQCRPQRMDVADVLYLPKGVVHTATAEDGMSAHLTISLGRDGLRWGDLFSAVCKHHADAGKQYRGCDSLQQLAMAVPAGVAWHRPFPVWLGDAVVSTPEVWQHFALLKQQLEHEADANRNTLVVLDGRKIERTMRPSITFRMILRAREEGWDSTFAQRPKTDSMANSDNLPPFMLIQTSRTRRGSCGPGARFRCPNGAYQPYHLTRPTDCDDSCDDRNNCDCDGYYGSDCDCDNPISCNDDCDLFQACFVQCHMCSCGAGDFLDGCTGNSPGRCSNCRTCTQGVQFMRHACTRTTNTVCETCQNQVCAGDNYRSGICSGHVDGYQCNTCESITCFENHYRTGSCGTSSNPTENGYQCRECSHQMCNGTNQWRSGTCSGTTDGYVCASCTECAPGHYRSAGCTPGVAPQADSTCTPLTDCGANQYESTAPTTTTDRVCTPVTNCSSLDDGHTASPATETSDAVCESSRACNHETEWQVAARTETTGWICDPLTVCGMDEYVMTQATLTTDRVCGACENSVCADTTFRSGVCDTGTGLGYTCETCSFLDCDAGEFRQGYCGGVTDGYNCTTCSNTDCDPDTFQTGVCDGTIDGWSCLPCTNTNCAAGEYRTGTCSGRNNSYDCNLCDSAECPELPEPMFRSGVCSGTVNEWQCNRCSNIRCGYQRHRVGACGGEGNTTDDGFDCVDDTPHCPAGEYVSQTATATSDLMCTLCGDDDYMDEIDHRNRECTAATRCTAGQFVAVPLTRTSNRVCADCPPGRHQMVAPDDQQYCENTWTSCTAGSYVEVLPSTSTDRRCAPCESCPNCNPGDQGSGVTTGLSNSWFNRGSGSGSGREYGSGSGSGEREVGRPPLVPCADCTPTFTDRSNLEACLTAQLCEPGTYSSAPPTSTADRVCTACPAGTYTAMPNTDTECSLVSTCPSTVDSYQQVTATPTSDTVCERVTICDNAGANQEDVVAQPTATSDRVCRPTTTAPIINFDSSTSNDDNAGVGNGWVGVVIGIIVVLAVVGYVIYRRNQNTALPSKGGLTATRDRFENPAYEDSPSIPGSGPAGRRLLGSISPYDTYDSADGGAKTGPSEPAGMYREGEPMVYEPVEKQPVYNVGNNSTAGGMRVDSGNDADAQLYTNTAPSGYGVPKVSDDDGALYALATDADASRPLPESYADVGETLFQESDAEYYTNGNKSRPGFNISSDI